ncbi:hypothetical protein GBAR_LOCUS10498 [Geodia barretti]|uniref:Uncharacterized protein n=1 Tax=Geodia barretti TaxID=519541 RepID=A0AA35RVK9_GEOBA|nr:hypothetical protein GBAR_LOCUS10498 [Geodia barretti]
MPAEKITLSLQCLLKPEWQGLAGTRHSLRVFAKKGSQNTHIYVERM